MTEYRERTRADLEKRLIKWVRSKRLARKGQLDDDGAALFGDWCPQYPETSWLLYTLMDATEWAHLPDKGGWLDQDEAMTQDVSLLSRMAALINAQMDANENNA